MFVSGKWMVVGALTGLLLVANAHAQSGDGGFVCDTTKHHVVIDHATDGGLRYRVWNKPRPESGKPDVEVRNGTREIAGTDPCVSTNWTFNRRNTEYWVSDSAACTDEKPPRGAYGMIVVTINKQFASRYWCVK